MRGGESRDPRGSDKPYFEIISTPRKCHHAARNPILHQGIAPPKHGATAIRKISHQSRRAKNPEDNPPARHPKTIHPHTGGHEARLTATKTR